MKKTLSLLLAVMLLTLTACSNNSNNPRGGDNFSPTTPSDSTSSGRNTSIPSTSGDGNTPNGGNGAELKVSEGKYIIGDYIKEAQYIVTCNEESRMSIMVFENENSYNDYDGSARLTYGKESEAIEQYALYDTYLESSESAFLSLNTGYVLKVDNGNGLLEKISLDTYNLDVDNTGTWDSSNKSAICTGV